MGMCVWKFSIHQLDISGSKIGMVHPINLGFDIVISMILNYFKKK
jgi:hypothetical protein